MSPHVIGEILIRDETRYAQYVERLPPVVQRFGGQHLRRGATVTPWAGSWNPERIVLGEFEDLA